MFTRTLALGVCALCSFSFLPSAATAAEFGIADVWNMIERSGLRRVEQVVRRLPDEMRSNYVLMASSKSNHQASATRPRVIMMSRDARLLAAFSGDPSDPAYGVFEMIEFHDKTDAFEFREITFAKSADRPAELSAANPVDCMGCHTRSLRPNWAPGVRWEGAVGERNSYTVGEMQTTKSLLTLADARYAALHRVDQLANSRADKESFASRMSKKINALNQRRIARWIYDTPEYERNKYAVVAALVRAPQLERMVSLDTFGESSPGVRAELIQQSFKPMGWWTSFEVDSHGIAQLQLLFEKQGLNPSVLSTSFDNPNLLTADSLTDFNGVLTRLYELDPRLAEAAPLPVGWQKMDLRTPETKAWSNFTSQLVQRHAEAQRAETLPLRHASAADTTRR